MKKKPPKLPQNFEEAFEEVKGLVAIFQANEARYLSSAYVEAAARKDFIDKFWMALGWDVNHDIQTNPYCQEVHVERATGTTQRKADYAFCLAPHFRKDDVRFYVEAKKPQLDIRDPLSCFQTIRYGFSSKTPLAVLTDFHCFHLLDCRFKPNLSTSLDRILISHRYTDYGNREEFAKIYWLLSHEAVSQGALEKFSSTLPVPHGKFKRGQPGPLTHKPVDESLLVELDKYRLGLARAFKKAAQSLDGDTLTEIVQRTLDRLVLMRFLEDKSIETDQLIDKLAGKVNAWRDFIALARTLDRTYNGIVFKKHSLSNISLDS